MPGAAGCRNERHRARLVSRLAGDGAHRDIERGMLGRAGICDKNSMHARVARTTLDQSRNREHPSEQSGNMGRVQGFQGYIYIQGASPAA